MALVCENCKVASPINKERYCKDCKKQILKRLKDEGYLQPLYYGGGFRTAEMRENTHETKYGLSR